jgi:hypothetical protein
LGVSFVRSCTEAGVKRVLNIPDGYRVDIMVGVGYKSKKRPPAMRGARPIVYHNNHGEPWNGSN